MKITPNNTEDKCEELDVIEFLNKFFGNTHEHKKLGNFIS